MKNKRKKQYVDRPVQGALVRRITLHWLLFFTVMFFALPLWKIMSTGDLLGSFSGTIVQSWKDSAPVFVILLAMIPMFIWDTVTLSHRFAGPMYRFRKTIQSLADGEHVRAIKLRDGDFWHDVADEFNRMLDRIESDDDDPTAGEPEPCTVGACDESSL